MPSGPPSPDSLLAIVRLQNEILAAGLDLDGVMRRVVERAGPLTDADAVAIELVDGDEMVYRAVSDSLGHALGLRLPRDGSLSGRCVAENAVLVCQDSESDRRVDRDACRKVGARSMICVPLVYQQLPVGVLKVTSAEARHFDDNDVAVLSLLANTLAACMQHARQFEYAVNTGISRPG